MIKYFWDASSIESNIEDWEFGALWYPSPQEILKKKNLCMVQYLIDPLSCHIIVLGCVELCQKVIDSILQHKNCLFQFPF